MDELQKFFCALVDAAGNPEIVIVEAISFYEAYQQIFVSHPDRVPVGVIEVMDAYKLSRLLVVEALQHCETLPIKIGE